MRLKPTPVDPPPPPEGLPLSRERLVSAVLHCATTLLVQASGFKVQAAGFRVQGVVFKLQGSEFRVQGSWTLSLYRSCIVPKRALRGFSWYIVVQHNIRTDIAARRGGEGGVCTALLNVEAEGRRCDRGGLIAACGDQRV